MTVVNHPAPGIVPEGSEHQMIGSPPNGKSKRRSERTPVLTPADAYSFQTRLGTVKVRNISPQGLGGASSLPLYEGQRIQVELTGLGTVPGQVIWTKGLAFGMGFDREIDIAELDVAGPLSSMRFTQVSLRTRPGQQEPVLPLRAETD